MLSVPYTSQANTPLACLGASWTSQGNAPSLFAVAVTYTVCALRLPATSQQKRCAIQGPPRLSINFSASDPCSDDYAPSPSTEPEGPHTSRLPGQIAPRGPHTCNHSAPKRFRLAFQFPTPSPSAKHASRNVLYWTILLVCSSVEMNETMFCVKTTKSQLCR